MKNKGFTIVEFAVSFCLIAAISLLLFQLIISLKTLYLNGNIKSTLLAKQGIMLQRINDDFDNNNLTTVTSCGLSCLTFIYENKEPIDLKIDPYNKTITYDDYTMLLDNGSSFGNVNVTKKEQIKNSTNINDSIFLIEIPIYNSLLNDNFDIKILLTYNSNKTTINTNINIADTTIDLDDMNIPIVSLNGKSGYYAEIFVHDVTTTKEVFTSLEEFKKSNTSTKKSALYALDLFKGKYNSSLNTDVFEFILKYPSYSSTENNHWYQSSNFLELIEDGVQNYNPVTIAWNNENLFTGIKKVSEEDTCGFANTSATTNENCYNVIGAKKLVNGGFKFSQNLNTTTSMKLYVRCDEFIEKYALANVIK